MKFMKNIAVIGIAVMLTGCSLFGGNDSTAPSQSESGTTSTENNEFTISDEPGNTNGNITNLGGASTDGKYIYCQNSEDGYKIYRTDKKGNKGEKLNDCESYFINVVGDYIYYCNGDDDFHIYRMKKDGSDNTMIYDHSVYYLNVSNGFLYFSDYDDGQTLYRMAPDGSKKWQLSEIKADYVNVVGDDVYYCNYDDTDNYGIYRVNFVSKINERVCAYICGYLNVTDDYLYFTDMEAGINKNGTNKLYRISRSDYDQSECVLESQVGTFTITDNGTIYYVNYDDEDKVYSCNKDGGNIKKVVDEQAKYVCVAGKKLFYMHVIDADNFEFKSIGL